MTMMIRFSLPYNFCYALNIVVRDDQLSYSFVVIFELYFIAPLYMMMRFNLAGLIS